MERLLIAYRNYCMTYLTDSLAAANMRFEIAGSPCFADTFVQGGSSVLLLGGISNLTLLCFGFLTHFVYLCCSF